MDLALPAMDSGLKNPNVTCADGHKIGQCDLMSLLDFTDLKAHMIAMDVYLSYNLANVLLTANDELNIDPSLIKEDAVVKIMGKIAQKYLNIVEFHMQEVFKIRARREAGEETRLPCDQSLWSFQPDSNPCDFQNDYINYENCLEDSNVEEKLGTKVVDSAYDDARFKSEEPFRRVRLLSSTPNKLGSDSDAVVFDGFDQFEEDDLGSMETGTPAPLSPVASRKKFERNELGFPHIPATNGFTVGFTNHGKQSSRYVNKNIICDSLTVENDCLLGKAVELVNTFIEFPVSPLLSHFMNEENFSRGSHPELCRKLSSTRMNGSDCMGNSLKTFEKVSSVSVLRGVCGQPSKLKTNSGISICSSAYNKLSVRNAFSEDSLGPDFSSCQALQQVTTEPSQYDERYTEVVHQLPENYPAWCPRSKVFKYEPLCNEVYRDDHKYLDGTDFPVNGTMPALIRNVRADMEYRLCTSNLPAEIKSSKSCGFKLTSTCEDLSTEKVCSYPCHLSKLDNSALRGQVSPGSSSIENFSIESLVDSVFSSQRNLSCCDLRSDVHNVSQCNVPPFSGERMFGKLSSRWYNKNLKSYRCNCGSRCCQSEDPYTKTIRKAKSFGSRNLTVDSFFQEGLTRGQTTVRERENKYKLNLGKSRKARLPPVENFCSRARSNSSNVHGCCRALLLLRKLFKSSRYGHTCHGCDYERYGSVDGNGSCDSFVSMCSHGKELSSAEKFSLFENCCCYTSNPARKRSTCIKRYCDNSSCLRDCRNHSRYETRGHENVYSQSTEKVRKLNNFTSELQRCDYKNAKTKSKVNLLKTCPCMKFNIDSSCSSVKYARCCCFTNTTGKHLTVFGGMPSNCSEKTASTREFLSSTSRKSQMVNQANKNEGKCYPGFCEGPANADHASSGSVATSNDVANVILESRKLIEKMSVVTGYNRDPDISPMKGERDLSRPECDRSTFDFKCAVTVGKSDRKSTIEDYIGKTPKVSVKNLISFYENIIA